MLVEIKEDVFIDADFKGLNFLIQLCFYKNRYEVFVDWDNIKDLENFKRLDRLDRDALELEFTKAIQGSLKINHRVSERHRRKEYFSIEESIRYLIQPVSIILENGLNDSYFIRQIARHFDATGKIIEHLDNGWLQFENAGGCGGVKNFIEGRMQSYNALPKDNDCFLRCFVLLDSDSSYPAEPIKQSYPPLVEYLNQKQIPLHILEKRCMENYLPDEVLVDKANPVIKVWIDAYLSLTPVQKDHVNFDKGFKVQTRGEMIAEVSNLYSSLSDTNFEILKTGLALGNFKTEFPKFMEHHHAHKQTFKSRTAHQNDSDELEKIINAIFELL